jgi:23S rRNA (cytidine1920-2'-O)/16S rRNA (cytidine1409-2'-O)-methyltransferase
VATEIRHRFSLDPEAAMRKRADVLLVERGFFASRARAQQAIAAGLVSADGVAVRKASEPLSPDAAIVAGAPHPWASRGGVKLAAALDAFALDPAGLACLDIGASTGGFTEVLLRRGARSVLSVDVGHGQFAPKLAADPRVTLREGLDARRLTKEIVGVPPQAIVCDVSFISQRLVLPNVLALADRAAWLISLVKPQFEAGRENLVKGAVKDPAALALSCEAVRRCVEGLGWTSIGLIPSPLLGGDGAREFLYAARHG